MPVGFHISSVPTTQQYSSRVRRERLCRSVVHSELIRSGITRNIKYVKGDQNGYMKCPFREFDRLKSRNILNSLGQEFMTKNPSAFDKNGIKVKMMRTINLE